VFDCGIFEVFESGELLFWWEPLGLTRFARWCMHLYREFFIPQAIFLGIDEESLVLACSGSSVNMQVVSGADSSEWKLLRGESLQYEEDSFLIRSDTQSRLPDTARVRAQLKISHSDWFRSMLRFGDEYSAMLLAIKDEVFSRPENFSLEDDADTVAQAFQFCDGFPGLRDEIIEFLAEKNITL